MLCSYPLPVVPQVPAHGVRQVDHLGAGHGGVRGAQEPPRRLLAVVVAGEDEAARGVRVKGGDYVVEVHLAVRGALAAGGDLHVPAQVAHRGLDVLEEKKQIHVSVLVRWWYQQQQRRQQQQRQQQRQEEEED